MRDDDGVLVIEDDPPLRRLIELALKHEKLEVTTARDGAEGIARLQERHFRVVLLDLMMPNVSGWDVIEWLREHPSSLPRTLIVVTAADRSVFAKLDPEIVNAIIVKPFDPYELAGYVRRCCPGPAARDRRHKRLVGRA